MTPGQIRRYSEQLVMLCDEVEGLDLSRLSKKELKELDRIAEGLDNVQFNLERDFLNTIHNENKTNKAI